MNRVRQGISFVALVGALVTLAPSSADAQSRNRDLITRQDIENSSQKDQDIYQVIRALRPQFLQPPKGVRTLGNSSSRMSVYVDGVREADFGALKNIMAATIEEVRYQDPSTAESEHGSEASAGAIMLKRLKNPMAPKTVADTAKPPQH